MIYNGNFDSSMVSVGDEVVIMNNYWFGQRKTIAEVQEKTMSGLIDVNGLRWTKDGKPYGNQSGFLMTIEEYEKQHEDEMKRGLLLHEVGNIRWDCVSTETIEKIIEMVKEDVKSNE